MDLFGQTLPSIFKYAIYPPGGPVVHTIHEPATFLHLGVQDGIITAWFQVDEAAKDRKTLVFRIRGTGHTLDVPDGDYIGTVSVGLFVWHVFMREET